MKSKLIDKIILTAIVLFVLATSTLVITFMVMPSNRDSVINELTSEGIQIIEQAQKWARLELKHNRADSLKPYLNLRYDKIGYMDGLSINGRVLSNNSGRFTITVTQDGSTFNLNAVGADRLSIVWNNIGLTDIPAPKTP